MSNMKMWQMKDGFSICIKDMTDNHLANTIKLVERAHEHAVLEGYVLCSSLNGEMASFCAERDVAGLEDEGPSAVCPVYDDLVEEQSRRKEISS